MAKLYFNIANLVLATAAIFLGVNIFYKVSLEPEMPWVPKSNIKRPAKKATAPRARSLAYYRPIVQRDLFKTKPAEVKPKAVNPEDVKNTDLNLKLWGTVAGTSQAAYAVIEETTKRKQQLYKIGDKIQNATIMNILREQVLLNVNGQIEKLAIEKTKSTARRGRTGTRQNLARRTPVTRKLRPQRISLKRARIESAVSDLNALMTQVKIQPNLENGQPNGVILTGIKPNSIFRRMGLRNGDVITAVDGDAIESPESAARLYENLRTANQLSLDLKRRGREKKIEYKIE